VAPLQVSQFHRDQRYQILPAYAQDGIVLSRVFRGATDGTVFEDFLSQLLQHCGRWPEPKSVVVMDNASFHHSERISQMCADAGVKLVYLPPYSPDLNPIEEFFAELKSFTAIFKIGFHALRKKIVSGTLTQNTLVLTRIVSMQGLLRQNYAVLLFQDTVTTSVLYTYKKQWIVKCMVARENRSESGKKN
jgi:transposase